MLVTVTHLSYKHTHKSSESGRSKLMGAMLHFVIRTQGTNSGFDALQNCHVFCKVFCNVPVGTFPGAPAKHTCFE